MSLDRLLAGKQLKRYGCCLDYMIRRLVSKSKMRKSSAKSRKSSNPPSN